MGFQPTNRHARFFSDVCIDRFTDAAPIADEIVTVLIASNTVGRERIDVVGPAAGRPVPEGAGRRGV